MSLNSVLKKRRRKKEMGTSSFSDSIIHDLISDTVIEITRKKFKESFDKLKKEVENEVKQQTDLILNDLKNGEDGDDGPPGKKGDKGDVGDTPTKTFLLSLIRPLIPKLKISKKGDKGDNIKGDKGDKGDNGSPDKPMEIIKKLNTLENVLDVKALKGLKPILKTIQDSIRAIKMGGGSGGSGGGMGTPIHQSFTCDGVTTSFTLSNNVAASGQAAWIYYQGQFLVNSTHWSISGKTLTLTFTPEDGTVIDVTYIRT